MLYPQVPLDEWAARYQIRTEGVPCPCCGEMLSLSKPIAMKGYRGIEAEICLSCGEDTGVFRVVPVDKDAIDLWESLRPQS